MELHHHTPYLTALIEAEVEALAVAQCALDRLELRVRVTELTAFGLSFEEDGETPLFNDGQDELLTWLDDARERIDQRLSKGQSMRRQLLAWRKEASGTWPDDSSGADDFVAAMLAAADLPSAADRHAAMQVICDTFLGPLEGEQEAAIAIAKVGSMLKQYLEENHEDSGEGAD